MVWLIGWLAEWLACVFSYISNKQQDRLLPFCIPGPFFLLYSLSLSLYLSILPCIIHPSITKLFGLLNHVLGTYTHTHTHTLKVCLSKWIIDRFKNFGSNTLEIEFQGAQKYTQRERKRQSKAQYSIQQYLGIITSISYLYTNTRKEKNIQK